jgi:ATP-dependent RNA helicase RhlE
MATNFADLGVSGPVRAALDSRGITTPFPVQELVLPVALTGRDVLVSSPTGSGKTLAFGLPLIARIQRGGARPSALVLAPTRELARQIDDDLTPLATAAGLRVTVCYGGVGLDRQATLAARADILVATPGRLLDLSRRGRLSLEGVSALVLDEADRMLDMGFLPQVRAIVARLPADRHTMFFSATLDGDVGAAAAEFTRSPERLRVREGAPGGAPLGDRLDQGFVACTSATRTQTLLDLIGAEDDLVLVFCRTRRGAERLAERLAAKGVATAAMHGDMGQSQRERALRRFERGVAKVLVATDVAARGIDLDDIGLVVNFDPPDDRDAYTHRVGRTARAGRTGRAITMVMPEHAADMGRIAAGLGLEEGWQATGYAAPAARVVYGSRRRGSAFGPTRPNRPRPGAPPAPPRANRVKRGSVRAAD